MRAQAAPSARRTPSRPASRSGYGRAQRAPLLPPAVQEFCRQRAIDCGGLLLLLLALGLGVAMASYDHRDPSRNHATSAQPGNLLGLPGAYVADTFLSSLGFAAALFPLAFGVWSVLILRRRSLRPWWLRIIALLLCVVLTALTFGFIPMDGFDTAGGVGGHVLRAGTTGLLRPYLGGAAPWLVAALAAAASLALLTALLGITLREWGAAVAGGAAVSRTTAAKARDMALALRTEREFDEDGPGFDDILHEEADPAEPEGDESLKDPSPAARVARRKLPAVRRESPASTAAAARQAREPEFLPLDEYALPPLTLLQLPGPAARAAEISEATLQATSEALVGVLNDFGVRGDIVRISPGPVVTLYELEPAPGTKSSRVIGLADDIARSLSAVSVRVAVVPGRNVIGIELPNPKRETVFLRELLTGETHPAGGPKLPLFLGKDIGGQPIVADLARMPHLLVAGTTGSGKSVAINTMILSLLYRLSPDQCRFIMIDPKMLELSVYDDIPHLLAPVVTEPKKAVVALKWTVREMEDRYRAMSKLGVRNVDGYNTRLREARENGEVLTRKVQTGFDPDTGKPVFEDQAIDLKELPYIVVVVDEFADLMLVAGKDIEGAIQRLAQMARAAGIHLIMATQRPSVDVITGTIKANFPTRISFAVTSKIDSRTILGESGAEQLLGQGDMLYMAAGGRITRVHGPFVRDEEVEHIVQFLKKQGEPSYVEGVTEEVFDPDEMDSGSGGDFAGGDGEGGNDLYDKAVALVARERKASTSFVQRHFQIGYNKAARLIERMEKEGVVSTANHVGKREVLTPRRGGEE